MKQTINNNHFLNYVYSWYFSIFSTVCTMYIYFRICFFLFLLRSAFLQVVRAAGNNNSNHKNQQTNRMTLI